MTKYILAINAGSATLKVKIFNTNLQELGRAQLERVGLTNSFLDYYWGRKSPRIHFSAGIKNHQRALKEIIKLMPERLYRHIKLVGHRVVHGGEDFMEATPLNKRIIAQIGRYNDFAPLHNPINLKTAEAAMTEFPQARHWAIFDTQYFKDLKEEIYLYAIPLKYYQHYGIRKYGFHGLSHEYMYQQAVKRFGRKNLNLITCHLGNGVSITAVKNGQVVDTSMGLTPLSGAIMGSRSGDLDPFIPLFLMQNQKLSIAEVQQELNFSSGLKGLCGASDLRDVLTMAGLKIPGHRHMVKTNSRKKELAKLAIKSYLYHIERYVGSYAGLIGRLDAVVFSGGVGYNLKEFRQSIMGAIFFIGRPKVLVIKANEELIMAQKLIKTAWI